MSTKLSDILFVEILKLVDDVGISSLKGNFTGAEEDSGVAEIMRTGKSNLFYHQAW